MLPQGRHGRRPGLGIPSSSPRPLWPSPRAGLAKIPIPVGHPAPSGGGGSPGMRGARPLATCWPVAEKLWWEAAMEEPGLSGCPLSAKTASFQVGEHSDSWTGSLFPKATFCAMSVDRPSGIQAISDDHNLILCGDLRKKPCHPTPCSEGLGGPGPQPHGPHSSLFTNGRPHRTPTQCGDKL